MQKRLIVVHGYTGNPDENWFPWLKKAAEAAGFSVHIPAMPDPHHPNLEAWLNTLDEVIGAFDENTYLVGHSLGCAAILRYAEQLPAGQICGGAVLVASFAGPLELSSVNSFVEGAWNDAAIRAHFANITLISSDNDPYIPFALAQSMQERLQAKLVVIPNGGHLNQGAGYTELPEVLTELQKLAA